MHVTNPLMKRILAIAGFIIVYHSVLSQSVSYRVENHTHELSPYKISFSFMNLETGFFPITAGLAAEGQVNDKLYWSMQFRKGYIRNFFIPASNVLTTQKESRGRIFEAGAEWVFSDEDDQGALKIVTDQTSYGNYISQNYFIAGCDKRKYWAWSGGIMQYVIPHYVNGTDSAYILSGAEKIYAPGENYFHFNLNTFGGYAGITKRKIRKAAVISDGWRYKRFYSTRFYVHMLIGASAAGDVIYNNRTYTVDNLEQFPLGYRIGWQWDEMGAITGLELGKLPTAGLKTNSSSTDALGKLSRYYNYFRLTFHFTIINGDKQYKLKQETQR